jgi:hypothetical protein
VTPPTLEQIDLLLAAWDERLCRMDENLLALENEAVYQVLAGNAGERPQLEGVTKERVGRALDAVDELFEDRRRLHAVFDEAKGVRAGISAIAFWDKDDKIAEVHRLLRGPSIALGHEKVALGQRNLLDESSREVRIEPEQVLARMASRFQEARTVLLALSEAWKALGPAMTGIEAEMRALRDLSADLAPPPRGTTAAAPPALAHFADLAEAEAELARVRAGVARDPLGAEGGVEREIRPRLVALRARLDAERGTRERVQQGIARAHDLRRRLGEAQERAQRLAGEVCREIVGPALLRLPPALDDGLLTGLDEWLGRIENAAAAHRWSPAEEYAASAAAAAAEAEALLGRRGELAGRLSARRAQAAALGARGVPIDPSSESRAREADALLRQRPVPLDEAARAVEQYEAAVVAQSARQRG